MQTSDLLKVNRERILSQWEMEVRAKLPAASHENKSALRDSLPEFIEDISDALMFGIESLKKEILRVAHKHGSERANLSDYTIEEALEEFNILRRIIFQVLEEHGILTQRERDTIYEVINFGFAKAGTEFARAQLKKEEEARALAQRNLEEKISLERKLRLITDIQPTMISYVDKDLRYQFVNDAYVSVFNKKREDLIGNSVEKVLGREAWMEVKPYLEKALKGEDTVYIKLLHYATGQRYMKVHYRPSFDKNNEVNGIFVSCLDLTEQMQTMEALKKSEEEFRTLSNAIPQLAWTAYPDGSIYWFNSRWYEFTGSTPEESLGWHWEKFIHPDFTSIVREKYLKMFNSGSGGEEIYPIRARTGEYRWFLSRAIPVKNRFGIITKWFGTDTDVTDQKKISDELQKEQGLRDRLIYTLSHDLRTPLTAAKMAGQLIKRKAGDADFTLKQSDRIINNINRADLMIQDLLDASRLKAGQLMKPDIHVTDISVLISMALEDLKTIYGDRFVFNSTYGKKICTWPEGIRRIIENLSTNAIKYGDHQQKVLINLREIDDYVEIVVRNFGKPIERSINLFDEFQRTSSAEKSGKKGWGIGLTIVKGVIESIGGEVRIIRHKDGTSFQLILPKDSRNKVPTNLPENKHH